MKEVLRSLRKSSVLESLGKALRNLKVLVIGDLILDRWIVGKVSRISPEAPVPILNAYRRYTSLGGAGNVARNIRELGAEVSVVGLIGRDRYGFLMEKLFREEDIHLKPILSKHRRTTVKTRVVADNNHQICRIDWEKSAPLTPQESLELQNILKNRLNLNSFHLIVISDYAKGVVGEELMKLLDNHREKVFSGPKPKNVSLLSEVALMSMNRKEFIDSLKQLKINLSEENIDDLVSDSLYSINLEKRVKNALNLKELIVTKGPRGMTLHTQGNIYYIPALARSVYDVTGAGDTVLAVYSVIKVVSDDPLISGILATVAASLAVSRFGTNAISWKELMEYVLSLREKDYHRLGKTKVYS